MLIWLLFNLVEIQIQTIWFSIRLTVTVDWYSPRKAHKLVSRWSPFINKIIKQQWHSESTFTKIISYKWSKYNNFLHCPDISCSSAGSARCETTLFDSIVFSGCVSFLHYEGTRKLDRGKQIELHLRKFCPSWQRPQGVWSSPGQKDMHEGYAGEEHKNWWTLGLTEANDHLTEHL